MAPETKLIDRLFPSPMKHPDIIRQGWKQEHPLHNFLVVLYHLARIPLPLCGLFIITLCAAAVLPHVHNHWAATILGIAVTGDLVLLRILPIAKISHGWVQPPWLMFAAGRALIALVIGLLPLPGLAQVLVLAGAQATLTVLSLYGHLIEPLRIEHAEISLIINGLAAPIRVALLTDLHMERMTRREVAALAAMDERDPDLIIIAGDLLNLSYVGEPTAMEDVRSFLGELSAPAGVFFVRGTPDVDPPDLVARMLDGLPITAIEYDKVLVEHEGATISLLGIPADLDPDLLVQRFRALAEDIDGPVICVHHTPDLLEEAAKLGIDLYVAGHTHGGQICMPVLGPMATSSRFGRRYARGLYRLDATTGYVSRGLGLEGLGAPRMRFLARPELVWITLLPPGEAPG